MLDSDGDGSTNLQEYQNGTAPVPLPGQSGFCQWDLFFIGTNNSKISALTQNPLFAQAPGLSGYFNAAEAGQNWGDNFGRRLRGVVTIPTTGTWRFYISGDNCTSLLINPSGKSRFGKSQVAFNTGASSFRSFSSGTPQSKAFNFNAGDKVYFEVLYVETTGSDHCSVGWSGPGYTSATLIPSSAISVCEPETITIDGTIYHKYVCNLCGLPPSAPRLSAYFCALAALGRSDLEPPFFAGANVPSIKHSFRSNLPRSRKSSANKMSNCSKAPCLVQF